MPRTSSCCIHVLFHSKPTTQISTLSLHDALPIYACEWVVAISTANCPSLGLKARHSRPSTLNSQTRSSSPLSARTSDRKSTRLNSSHPSISYAVFCLKKKNPGRHYFYHPLRVLGQ